MSKKDKEYAETVLNPFISQLSAVIMENKPENPVKSIKLACR